MIDFPASPTTGQEHTAGGKTWIWDGVRWAPKAVPTDPAAVIHAAPSKPTPADADEFGFVDSGAGWGLQKLTWANLKAALLAYFKGQFREKLTAPRTYYVRTDGSDSNDGLSNTAGGAFLTIQKAIDSASALDNGGYLITIRVADGAYGSFSLRAYVGAAEPKIIGNAATAASVLISAPSTNAINAARCGAWTIGGMKVQSTSNAGVAAAGAGTRVTFSDSFEFGATGAQHVLSTDKSWVNIACPWRITGNCTAHIAAIRGASVLAYSQACTMVGTPALGYFVYVETASDALVQAVTFTGSATGKKYEATLNGVIQTYGSGASYFPGSVAGTVATGGQYA